MKNRYFVLLLVLLLCGCAGPASLSWRPAERPASGLDEKMDASGFLAFDGSAEVLLQREAALADSAVEVVADDAETQEDNAVLTVQLPDAPEPEAPEKLAADAEPVVAAPMAPRYDFPVVENARVQAFIDYYTGPGRRTFSRWLERSGRYLPLMSEIFAEEGLPRDLALLAMIESGFNSNARSWANAVGYWQFLDSTGRLYGLRNDWWRDERRDLEKSTRAAGRYLKDLYSKFDDWYLAVAAYNAGPGTIGRAIRRSDSRDFWQLARGKDLQLETRNYLPKLLAALIISKQPEEYGFDAIHYEQPFRFERVELPQATDLELVARLLDSDYETLKELNPELKRWCTPPGERGYRLRVPPGSASDFAEKYAAIPPQERARYHRYQVRPGDTLGRLAQRHGVAVNDLIALNRIRNPRALKVGQDLILPLQAGKTTPLLAEQSSEGDRGSRQSYRVQSGDSLWKIARAHQVSEKDLRLWNRLGWSSLLQPGQTLLVSAPPQRAQLAQVATPAQQRVAYRVKTGDTLWGISRRFGVAAGSIRQWNNLAENHVLQPGETLTLLVTGGRS